MTVFVLINTNTNQVVAEEGSLSNAIEHTINLEDAGMNIRIDEISQDVAG